MRLLAEGEFNATFGHPMRRIDAEADAPFEFWNYFDSIPTADFHGFDCSSCRVEHVYEDSSGRFQHVLVDSHARDVFMVIVLDLRARSVLGHRLLNLPALYGLDDAPGSAPTDPRAAG